MDYSAPPTALREGKGTYSARFLQDNGLQIATDDTGRVIARPPPESPSSSVTETTQSPVPVERIQQDDEQPDNTEEDEEKKKKKPIFFKKKKMQPVKEQPAKVVPNTGFNVILTHATADFDSLASAVGLAKLWGSSSGTFNDDDAVLPSSADNQKSFDSASHVPTFVVLPRGAHPGVQRFLALHKHLFPIRSLKSLPSDLSNLNRLALVDAQRRERLGPAANLLQYANRVTVVDHHIDQDSDIEATDYVVDNVGSVTTLIVEHLIEASENIELTEAEATLLALGIHADTGSLCFDSTTPRDASALAWCLVQGASQAAIAEHAQSSLSPEQQGVLTQALVNTNSTIVHGVTVSTVLLSADGFINGLAAVAQDALELSSSDVFLLSLVYEAQAGGRRRSSKKKKNPGGRSLLTSRLLKDSESDKIITAFSSQTGSSNPTASLTSSLSSHTMYTEAWQGGEVALRRRRLRAAFDRKDTDGSGFLDESELAAALASSGVIASDEAVSDLMSSMDTDGDGKVDFEEFVAFAADAEKKQQERDKMLRKGSTTMIVIGRVRAGVNMKGVKLNKLFERFGGGGHAKAASATLRLNDEAEAEGILQGLVDELIETSLQKQPTVGDFMTAPVLSAKPHMTEKQVEDMFLRYDVRALPVVDDNNDGTFQFAMVFRRDLSL